MTILTRLSLNSNNDEHYEALINRQSKNKNNDTSRNYAFIPTGSTLMVQCKDGGPWTHGTIVKRVTIITTTTTDHIQYFLTQTGLLITRNNHHVKPIQKTAEQYLWDKTDK